MNKPKISIITVVFNGAEALLHTLKSIASLTYSNIEYVIVDGGSTDGTVDIIRQNESIISRWVSEPDKGLYDAMNKGMNLATGDYFWFVNAGDEPASPEVLNDLFSEGHSADVYYGETLLINPDGSEIGLRRLSPPEKLNWRHFRRGMLVSHQSFIASRKVAKEYDLRYKFSADFDWCLHALRNASKINNTHKVLCRFREGGLTKQNILPGLRERFRIMVKNYGLISAIFAHFVIAPKFLWYWARNKRF
ncbi:glycosyltransferase family 2 protein [Marinilabilia sp.]|uniref:glycosyltransferase family 2 protein n=1 Tax=Marinilabilia sp. TaxID=2021252 RepID=UPI0025B9FBCB|nr:glycosyltransferase family 2 protein [Marinilabilia sp.]